MSKVKKYILKVWTIFVLNVLLIMLFQANFVGMAQSYSQGSQGETVKQIQQKLISWGYMTGSADGIYGFATKKAVIAFQQANGLTADGVCGTRTLEALGIYEKQSTTTSSSSSSGLSNRQDDLYLLSHLISAEARGEEYQGQVAVGAVVINRTKHPSFPNTIAGVIYEPGAFSSVSDGQFYDEPVESARRAAEDALNGMDPSGGAIYFYNPAKSVSQWIFSRTTIKIIGKHTFAE